jgi:hypothetical protein
MLILNSKVQRENFYIKKQKNNMIKLKKLQKKMVFMFFVLVMNFQHILIKLFILVCIKKKKRNKHYDLILYCYRLES